MINRTPWVVGALGLAVAGLAAAYTVETALIPTGSPVSFLPLPAAYDAEAALTLRSNPARARAASLKALAIRPADARAWLDLALLDARRPGHLGRDGVNALQRSYDMAPYDPQLISDRVALVYDHWAELPEDLRQETMSEMRTAWPYQDQKDQLAVATAKVEDPKAKLALAIELFRLRTSEEIAKTAARAKEQDPGLNQLQ